jgi:hypothetical protein
MGASQHFVPQFYFRLFTGGGRRINVLIKKQGRVVQGAGLREQCARHRFYGSEEIESLLCELEGRHSHAIRRIVECARSSTATYLTPDELHDVYEAVLFQRSRTQLEVNKTAREQERFTLELFKKHLLNLGDDRSMRIVSEIERGSVELRADRQALVLQSIEIALQGTPLISDMSAYILRNHTDYPFIFSDAPVVFYNTLYQRVVSRGVLGLQTPGMQIFYPLDSELMLLLIDADSYRGQFKKARVVDVRERGDISQLNVLQLHHSLNTVYFAGTQAAGYILDLWNAHKGRIAAPGINGDWRPGWLVDGKPVDGLYHCFERQLNFPLRLSFIECDPIADRDFKFRRRDPELCKRHKRWVEEIDRRGEP